MTSGVHRSFRWAWIEGSQRKFAMGQLQHQINEVGYCNLWTCNVSVRRSLGLDPEAGVAQPCS